VRECAGLQGSYSELHLSDDPDSRWEKPVVPGSLLGVIMMGLAKRLPWNTRAAGLYGLDHVRFINPVFHGDKVQLSVEVVDREDYDDEHGLLTFEEQLNKPDGTLAVSRNRIFLVDKRETA
jgi:acyl dehydratase